MSEEVKKHIRTVMYFDLIHHMLNRIESEILNNTLTEKVSIGSSLTTVIETILININMEEKSIKFLQEKLVYIESHMLRLCQNSTLNPPGDDTLLRMTADIRKLVTIE